jgi:hypothetical protein
VPLRERNALLVRAGYAPMYRERPLDDPALAAAREAVQLILRSHEPYPRPGGRPALEPGGAQRDGAAPAGRRRSGAAAAAGERAAPEPAPAGAGAADRQPGAMAAPPASSGCGSRSQATGDDSLQQLERKLRAYPVRAGRGSPALAGEVLGVAMPLQLRFAGRRAVFHQHR